MLRSAHARTAPLSMKRIVRSTLLAACIAACAGSTAREAYGQYYWDPNHTLTSTAGGSGYWDGITANWLDPNREQDVALQGNTPYFTGAGGVVSLRPYSYFLEQVEFDSGGYLVENTGTGNPVGRLSINWFTQGSTASGVNEISAPININDAMSINGGTLKLTNIDPQNLNGATGIGVASGATLECVVTPQVSYLPDFANLELSGTLQLDQQGSASKPIRLYNDISLENGSNVVFTGAPNPVEFTSMSGLPDGANNNSIVTSIISGTVGTVLYLDNLNIAQYGTFTFENDIDVHVGSLAANYSTATFVKTGTGRLIIEGPSLVTDGLKIDVQQGVFAIVGTPTLNPVNNATILLDGGTLSLEAASGSPVYDNPLSVTSNGGLLAVGGPSVTLGSSTNGIILQGAGLKIDTSPSGVANHLIIEGNVSGPGQAITVNGTGALTLAGVSTVSATTAHASFLEVNGVLNSDNVTIDTGGMLGGHGTISGSISLLDHSVLAPAGSSTSSAGSTLTLLGSVKFVSPDTGFSVNVAGGNSGQYDQVAFGDSLSVQGDLIINDITGPLAPGSKLWIMDGLPGSSPITGQFLYNGALLQSGSELTLADGTTYQIDYNLAGDPAGTGNDVVLTAVPEPGCAPLLAGALTLLARRKRIAGSEC